MWTSKRMRNFARVWVPWKRIIADHKCGASDWEKKLNFANWLSFPSFKSKTNNKGCQASRDFCSGVVLIYEYSNITVSFNLIIIIHLWPRQAAERQAWLLPLSSRRSSPSTSAAPYGACSFEMYRVLYPGKLFPERSWKSTRWRTGSKISTEEQMK